VRIRQLEPGPAWNEAERRGMALAFVGFFSAGVICVFGYEPGIRDAFLAGICGAIGLFLGSIAFHLGFYHRKLVLALLSALVLLVLPSAVTALLLPLVGGGKAIFVPGVAFGIVLYMVLHRLHLSLSGTTLETYVAQLAYDKHGIPKAKWELEVFWVSVALGAGILLLILAGLSR